MKNKEYLSIPAEKFQFVSSRDISHDKKFDTKPVGYLKDAFRRFSKNKASVVAAAIIIFLVIYAVFGPLMFNSEYLSAYGRDTELIHYKELLPKAALFEGTGFWDGSSVKEISQFTYNMYRGVEQETGYNPIQKVIKEYTTTDAFGKVSTMYKVRVDSYYANSAFKVTLTAAEYKALQDWQDENGIQVILPYVSNPINSTSPNIWYETDQRGAATLDRDGNFIPAYYTTGNDDYVSGMRLANDPYNDGNVDGRWRYAQRTGTASTGYNYVVRVGSYNYFQYRYGFEPSFAFGSDTHGYDIFSRLASGARFSLLLAVGVSVINLLIGAIYGAIEGYYGGVTDMFMERISDVLANVPFTVVAVLFQLHLAGKWGIVPSLLFAFVLTGWIGIASRVRMQFYRFKNQEYVLAARTLGAGDFRIMFKHIFPNSLGTIITSSVLIIPGVIFSETSLSYLGIINLDSPTMASVGTMLSLGRTVMANSPHVVLFPAVFIGLLMISFNLFGNGLRDAFNPSLRGVEE